MAAISFSISPTRFIPITSRRNQDSEAARQIIMIQRKRNDRYVDKRPAEANQMENDKMLNK